MEDQQNKKIALIKKSIKLATLRTKKKDYRLFGQSDNCEVGIICKNSIITSFVNEETSLIQVTADTDLGAQTYFINNEKGFAIIPITKQILQQQSICTFHKLDLNQNEIEKENFFLCKPAKFNNIQVKQLKLVFQNNRLKYQQGHANEGCPIVYIKDNNKVCIIGFHTHRVQKGMSCKIILKQFEKRNDTIIVELAIKQLQQNFPTIIKLQQIRADLTKFIEFDRKYHQPTNEHRKNLCANRTLQSLRRFLTKKDFQELNSLIIDYNIALHEFLKEKKLQFVSSAKRIQDKVAIFVNEGKVSSFSQNLLDENNIRDLCSVLINAIIQLTQLNIVHNDLKWNSFIMIQNSRNHIINYKVINLQLAFLGYTKDQLNNLDLKDNINFLKLQQANKKLFQFQLKSRKPYVYPVVRNDLFYRNFNQRIHKLPNKFIFQYLTQQIIQMELQTQQIMQMELQNYGTYMHYYYSIELHKLLKESLFYFNSYNIKNSLQRQLDNLVKFDQIPTRQQRLQKYKQILKIVQNEQSQMERFSVSD